MPLVSCHASAAKDHDLFIIGKSENLGKRFTHEIAYLRGGKNISVCHEIENPRGRSLDKAELN